MDRVVYQRIALPMEGSRPLLSEISVTWFAPPELFDEILQWVNSNLELTIPSNLRLVGGDGDRKFRSLEFWVDGEHKVKCLEMTDEPVAKVNADVH